MGDFRHTHAYSRSPGAPFAVSGTIDLDLCVEYLDNCDKEESPIYCSRLYLTLDGLWFRAVTEDIDHSLPVKGERIYFIGKEEAIKWLARNNSSAERECDLPEHPYALSVVKKNTYPGKCRCD